LGERGSQLSGRVTAIGGGRRWIGSKLKFRMLLPLPSG
jgi:hypothetical protein